MRYSLLLIFTINLTIFTVLPTIASGTDDGYAYQFSNKQPEQYGLVNDNRFSHPVAFITSAQGQINNVTQTRVNLNSHSGQFEANHGEAPVGVMGCMLDPIAGTFLAIYPGSDLLRYGIKPGDYYLAIRGQSTVHTLGWFQDMTRGKPGTYVAMTVLHDGSPIDIEVMRKDSRLFVQYYSGDNYFSWCAAQTRYW